MLRLELCPRDSIVVSRVNKLSVTGCNRLLKTDVISFCKVLASTVNLRHVELDWKCSAKEKARVVAALKENGSIIEGLGDMVPKDILKRNKQNHEQTLQSVVCFLAVRNTRRGLVDCPREIVQMIASMLWMTRFDLSTLKK